MNYYIESGDSVKKRYPKSFLKLILFGFALFGTPLIGTLIYFSIVLDNFAERSRETIYQATEIAHGNRVLADEALAMERSLRQASILNDLSLLEGYFHSHEEFKKTIEKFNELLLNTEYKLLLKKIRLSELVIFDHISDSNNSEENLQRQIKNFSILLGAIHDLKISGNILIGQYVNEMFERATQVRSTIELLLLAVIPFVIVLAILLSILITRPIKQIDEAIYNLGQGELNTSINVTGPQNLRQLGERLDWLRRRLLRLEKQKNQFLRHISHELKTPLTAIREGADLLAEGITGNLSNKQQSIANILHSSSLQLQKRIEDLLSYSAIQFTETTLVKEPVSLAKILDDTLQNQNLSIVNKQLKIVRNRLDIIYKCDEKKIQTIFDNLLSNAIKFSPANSSIEINISKNNMLVMVDFKDSGCGIRDEDKDKIFEPFYQGQPAPEAHVKGTGLGLSIAQEFAFAHEGRILLIKPEKPGTHFQLILPRQTNE
ncbi:MAG: HAMP domain-containing histidine kinase [Burkholderiales bacterium]|nr:HAMP domain-containing histidine kinase [Burkholderiales bacterium]